MSAAALDWELYSEGFRAEVVPLVQRFRPPQVENPREWADTFRKLAPPARDVGQYKSSKTPYIREPAEALARWDVKTVVFMTSTQVGKTELVLNAIGYFTHVDPTEIVGILPTVDSCEGWSAERLETMVEATPVLRELFDKKDKLKRKTGPGFTLNLVGSNSPVGLASRQARFIFADEVDKYPTSAKHEGDPLTVIERRQQTYEDIAKRLYTSSPTTKGLSVIEKKWDLSDKRFYWVPCVHCGILARLRWKRTYEDEPGPFHHVRYGEEESEAAIVCGNCECEWTEPERITSIENGEWIPSCKPKDPMVRGYQLSELYSPWLNLPQMVIDWRAAVESMAGGDFSLMIPFVNTRLGELWEDKGTKLKAEALADRGEVWEADVLPQGVILVTCGVDVQKDRIELEVVGWGFGLESWSLDWKTFKGNPDSPGVWRELDKYLRETTWKHETGLPIYIRSTCIDSSDNTDTVYRWARKRTVRRTADGWKQYLFAIKGKEGDRLLWPGEASKSKLSKQVGLTRGFYTIGVDTGKDIVHRRLKLTEAGPGFCHFPEKRAKEYFAQLTAEKRVRVLKNGRVVQRWLKDPPSARNEALDMRVYATAAVSGLEQVFGMTLERHDASLRRIAATRGSNSPPRPGAATPGPRTSGLAGRTVRGRMKR